MKTIGEKKKAHSRQMDHKTPEKIRTRAVRQVEAGESREEVFEAVGSSRWAATPSTPTQRFSAAISILLVIA
jgi:hypothetical protein